MPAGVYWTATSERRMNRCHNRKNWKWRGAGRVRSVDGEPDHAGRNGTLTIARALCGAVDPTGSRTHGL